MSEVTKQETLTARRQELVEASKDKVNSLFSLMRHDDSDENEQQSNEFAVRMCLSEIYRSVAYWEQHLYEVIKNIQLQKNQNTDGNSTETQKV